jgi:hypothetical protein
MLLREQSSVGFVRQTWPRRSRQASARREESNPGEACCPAGGGAAEAVRAGWLVFLYPVQLQKCLSVNH